MITLIPPVLKKYIIFFKLPHQLVMTTIIVYGKYKLKYFKNLIEHD